MKFIDYIVPQGRRGVNRVGIGPAVDWIVAKKIREPLMGCRYPAFLSKILTEFGYKLSEVENFDFIKVQPV
ncbi:MAG: hypothetical protein JW913_17370 [Chitinispirillaceae bacterium]|nr:hypothetical protein [Chitinispirillaceae bacterium]